MNSKYDQIISEFVKNTSLKKIRVTVDPKVTGFEHDSTYEGFVLEEDQMGNIVAIVPDLDGDNIMEIPFGGYSPCEGGMDIDCLLYTSPSPRDGLLSRMPSSA